MIESEMARAWFARLLVVADEHATHSALFCASCNKVIASCCELAIDPATDYVDVQVRQGVTCTPCMMRVNRSTILRMAGNIGGGGEAGPEGGLSDIDKASHRALEIASQMVREADAIIGSGVK